MKQLANILTTAAVVAGTAFAQDTMVPQAPTEAKPIKVGDTAPNGTLRTVEGKKTSLKAVLAGKPTVVIFYRGSWCPFCNRQLAEMVTVEKDLANLGYQIVAISPDTPENLKGMTEKDKLTYSLYSDSKAELLKKFGVAFRLDDKTFNLYKNKYGLDLEQHTGEKNHILPVPTVYLLDKDGKVTFVHSNPDYKVRISAEKVMEAAKANAGK